MTKDLQLQLQDLLDRVPGGRAAMLADPDGIAVAATGHDPSLEVDVLAGRYAVVLRDLRGALDRLGHGDPTQVIFEMRGAKIIVLPLKEAFALYLILDPDHDLGRGLFEARKTAPGLEASL
jgi:predicted regulator of Ras-like GTPase activity (Roadblock/LC7/MglB family)